MDSSENRNPIAKLEPGEFIERHIVPLDKILETLKGKFVVFVDRFRI